MDYQQQGNCNFNTKTTCSGMKQNRKQNPNVLLEREQNRIHKVGLKLVTAQRCVRCVFKPHSENYTTGYKVTATFTMVFGF